MQARSGREITRTLCSYHCAWALIMLCAICLGIACTMIYQDDDNLFDDGISYIDNAGSVWATTSPVRQLLLVTFALIAIYACFVGYRGGRSGQRFYNDRTIEKVLVPYLVFLLDGSALLRPSIFLQQITFLPLGKPI